MERRLPNRLKARPVHTDDVGVSAQLAVPIFAVGAGALAIWLELRFPKLGPEDMRGVIVHAVCAYGFFLLGDGLFAAVAGDELWRRLIAIFVVNVTALVYMLVVCLWVLKVFRGAVSAAR